MLKRIGIGLLLSVLSLFAEVLQLVLEDHTKPTCTLSMGPNLTADTLATSYSWASSVLSGISLLAVVITLYEFVIVQTPYQLKGFMMSLTMCSFAIFNLLGYSIHHLFQVNHLKMLTYCRLYLCITCTILSVATFLIFIFVSSWYQLRKRDDIVPNHLLAENYLDKNYSLQKRVQQQIKDSVLEIRSIWKSNYQSC